MHLADHAVHVSARTPRLAAGPRSSRDGCTSVLARPSQILYSRRSSLGLVGSSLDVGSSTWVSRDATIGPGTDSFYEYLLKVRAGRAAALGVQHELGPRRNGWVRLPRTSAVVPHVWQPHAPGHVWGAVRIGHAAPPGTCGVLTWLWPRVRCLRCAARPLVPCQAVLPRRTQVPGTLRGYSFLADVHMDSGRMSRPFVSSLGAFWPGMQALAGELTRLAAFVATALGCGRARALHVSLPHDTSLCPAGQRNDAVELHSNFTAAWQTWGWMPELFGLDLTRVGVEPCEVCAAECAHQADACAHCAWGGRVARAGTPRGPRLQPAPRARRVHLHAARAHRQARLPQDCRAPAAHAARRQPCAVRLRRRVQRRDGCAQPRTAGRLRARHGVHTTHPRPRLARWRAQGRSRTCRRASSCQKPSSTST